MSSEIAANAFGHDNNLIISELKSYTVSCKFKPSQVVLSRDNKHCQILIIINAAWV